MISEIPVFPLPDYVLLPKVVTGLHIFEQRYRDMINRVLDSHGIFCMGTLVGNWKDTYYDTPTLAPIACVCSVINYEQFDDGRYNVIIQGEKAVNIEEIESDTSYRMVKIDDLPHDPSTIIDPQSESLLREHVQLFLNKHEIDDPTINVEEISIESMIYTLSFHLEISTPTKLSILQAPTLQDAYTLLEPAL